MPPIKTHIFRGKRFKIDLDPTVVGWCDTPQEKQQLSLRIFRPLTGKRDTMEVLIHESLHACFPDMTEKQVETSAADISKFLWRIGYRRKVRNG